MQTISIMEKISFPKAPGKTDKPVVTVAKTSFPGTLRTDYRHREHKTSEVLRQLNQPVAVNNHPCIKVYNAILSSWVKP